MTAAIPKYKKLKIARNDRDLYSFVEIVKSYLVKYFPDYAISVSCTPYSIKVHKEGNYKALHCSVSLDPFPSCCGWSIYNNFTSVDSIAWHCSSMGLNEDQEMAFRDALKFMLQASVFNYAAPNLMGVFVSTDDRGELDVSALDERAFVVKYQWALESMCDVTEVKVLDSRINRNSSNMINTVVFAKPTAEALYAAWN